MPYWSGDSFRKIVQTILLGRVVAGPDIEPLRSTLQQQLAADVVLCGSASLAIELALRTAELQPGDEVVIPAFCCSAVVPPVIAAGGTPVLADIGDELNLTADTVAAVTTRKTKAVIVPHLFGNPAEINVIAAFAKAKNVLVIDDAAQALGATIDNRPVGSFGDFGVFSFGNEKICFGLGGGVLVSRQPELMQRMREYSLARPRASRQLRNTGSYLFWRRWRRWTYPLQSLAGDAAAKDPLAPPIEYRKEAMANLQAAVAASLLRSLPENLHGRRARVQAYGEQLAGVPRLSLFPHRAGSACLTQVMHLKPRGRQRESAAHLIALLRQNGYEVQGSFLPLHFLPEHERCVWEALPRSEKIWSDLIELPCEPSVSFEQIESICALIRDFVARLDAAL